MTENKIIRSKYFIPTNEIAKAAAEGLALHEKFGVGGTEVGLARAKQLSNKENVSQEDIIKIASYFARHEVDKTAPNFYNKDKPSKGYIAWQLWGGDAGQKWANDIKTELESSRIK